MTKTSEFKSLPDNVTTQEAAGMLIEDDTYLGGITRLVRDVGFGEPEYNEVVDYVHAYTDVEEYLSVRFMYACFTLLLKGDDNF